MDKKSIDKEQKKNTSMTKQEYLKSVLLKQKIALAILITILLAVGILFVVENFIIQKISYFSQHFMLFVILICVGTIIEILVSQSRSKITGDGKGDALMEKLGIAAYVFALISILISYLFQ